MTLLFMNGIDDVAAESGGGGVEVGRIFTSGFGKTSTTGGRFGGGYFTTDGGTLDYTVDPLGTIGYQTLIVGTAIKRNGASWAASSSLISFRNVENNPHCKLGVNTSGQLLIYDANNAIVATSAQTLAGNTWYFVEFKATIGASGSMEVRVDQGFSESDVFVEATAQDFLHATGTANIRHVTWGDDPTNIFKDDPHICDTNGSFNNDFLGDGRIYHLRPNVDVLQEYSVSTGSDHFAVVDETPRDTADFISSVFEGNQDRFGFEDLPVTPDKVDAVVIAALARKPDGGGTDIKTHITSGATTSEGAEEQLISDWHYYYHPRDTDPNTSLAWTRAAVNAAEGGVKVS